MNNIQNTPIFDSPFHQQIVYQQQTMISVFKEEIIRLQEQILKAEREKDEYITMYTNSLQKICVLEQKVLYLKEHNECLHQTIHVFQKEYMKQNNHLSHGLKGVQPNLQKPFFQQLIQNMKAKFNRISQPIAMSKKSKLSSYYGLIFHENVEQQELQLYNEMSSLNIYYQYKLKNFGKKYSFNEKFRHVFWFNTIQNHQKINYQLYKILQNTLDHNPEALMPSLIDLDLKRMDLKVTEQQAKLMKKQIKKCLQIFTLYRPDIGYVQGMSYFAWMLVMRMKTYEAFVCFSNIILNDPFIHSLYMFKKNNLNKILNFYEECLSDKKPKLYRHFKKLEIQYEFFIIEWAYTFFSRAFNLRIVSKIWDLWLCTGFNVFFKVTMVIMDMLESELLDETEDNRIVQILRNQTHKLDENEFLKNLGRQRLFEDLRLDMF